MKLRDTEYWKKELGIMHPTEYIALLQAIHEHQVSQKQYLIPNSS